MTALDFAASGTTAFRTNALAQKTRALSVLVFLSGFSTLIYQLAGQRTFSSLFGINVEVVTIAILALGLGIGCLVGGWLSQRTIAPLPFLAATASATGICGLVWLALTKALGGSATINLGLVVAPTLLSAALMGVMLPVAVSDLVRQSGSVGRSFGRLYSIHMLGIGAACLVGVAVLFPFLGIQGAVYAAVLLNTAVAVGALVMHRRNRHRARVTPADGPAFGLRREPHAAFAPVLALAAAGGFMALSYEVFFFRTVSYAAASSATAFAATLTAFMVGLASGARHAGEQCALLSVEELMRRAARNAMSANLIGFAVLPLLNHLAWLDRGVIGVAMLLSYLVARAWGTLLPYLAELSIPADARAGMRSALIWLAHIAGAAAGAILTGVVLMDHLGLVAIGVVLVIAGVRCVLLLVATLELPRRQKIARSVTAVTVAALAMALLPRASATVLENLHRSAAKPFTQMIENRNGVITVDANGDVFDHGAYNGRFNIDLKHDRDGIVRPYALSLFHGAPRNVLIIGLSSGAWAQVIANNPHVASLTIVERNPGYLTLVGRAPAVASVLTNPKVTIVIDDGRRWLQLNANRRFDAVIANTFGRTNATSLASAEFLDLVKARLNDGGVLLYNTADSARVQRTGCLTFAHGARFTSHLVAASTPIAWDFARWRHTLESYRIDGRKLFDLTRKEDRATLNQLMAMETSLTAGDPHTARPIEPCRDILTRTAGQHIVTDDNMAGEWRDALGLE